MKINERIPDHAIIPEKKRMLPRRNFPKGNSNAAPENESEPPRCEPFTHHSGSLVQRKIPTPISRVELAIENHILPFGTEQVHTLIRRRTPNLLAAGSQVIGLDFVNRVRLDRGCAHFGKGAPGKCRTVTAVNEELPDPESC